MQSILRTETGNGYGTREELNINREWFGGVVTDIPAHHTLGLRYMETAMTKRGIRLVISMLGWLARWLAGRRVEERKEREHMGLIQI